MKKSMIKITLISLLMFVQIGCGSTKGYEGAEIEKDKLSTIIFTNKIYNKHPEKTGDIAYVASIDETIVGNYFKGWPSEVKVKPGDHKVKLRYYPRSGGTFNPFLLFGAVGGAIGGSIVDKNSNHNYLTVLAKFEEGKEYGIGIQSVIEDSSKEVVYIWVYEFNTYKVVGGEKPDV